MSLPFKKVTLPVPDICQGLALTPEAQALNAPGTAAQTLFEALVAQELFADAVRFLARGLPKREAVWWACLCARDRLPPDARPEIEAALKAAEDWVYRPTEENRRAAMAKAEAAQFDTPSSWAAVGAFWSGGSLSPAGNPVVPPAEHLTGLAVSGSIMLSALQTEPQQAPDRYRQFLAYGANIAGGGRGRDTAPA
ncbi:hypothetical protein GCM10011611_15890 [Aliidongia dinghuensis]|uniref:Uncharacterized protein n=1 Tax=Aliidongia dinghuensis TaxID=1867774 RepID=A0A8J3E2U5_9PROT|nr:hypothetical protein [Aliidongia dinghuensis]GGF11072.1 hypothetical protein GCM10011611_15890 [Aliidongia dinghuensis]